MTTLPATLSITISHGVNAENQIFRLKRGTNLRIIPDASLLGRRVAVYCNLPARDDAVFIRKQYKHLNWFNDQGKKITTDDSEYTLITNPDIFCELTLNRAGSYHFYFTYEPTENDATNNKHESGNIPSQGSLYVLVEPIIKVGSKNKLKVMSLDSIRCQTVLSKCLGTLSTWENKLLVAKNTGYNMIHFTPIQELGGSKSAYSIQDQQSVNSDFGSNKTKPKFEDVAKILKKMREEWGVTSICDIVLNHTANESKWIYDHPEASYSAYTTPHLRPAILLDALLAQVSADTAAGLLQTVGVPEIIETEDHIQALKYQIHTTYLPKVNIHEFYQCNIEKYFNKFTDLMRNSEPTSINKQPLSRVEVTLIQDPEYKRLGCSIDFDLAYSKFNVFRPDCFDEDTRKRRCSESFRSHLESLNNCVKQEIDGYMNQAVENAVAGTRYERVQGDGPKVKVISIQYPLFTPYFTEAGLKGKPLKQIEESIYTTLGKHMMAHNGWVMGSDPLEDFARPHSGNGNVYLKRELIAWGDSIKLRFGDKPEDSPFLWNFVRSYVETTAKLFDGIRMDNCHSTPLHVAEYMLDAAREINPELYVVAELFTNSEMTDNIFVNRLGITSLIREAQIAWDSHEEGRLVYRYGGAPVGAFYNSIERPLAPTIAHALFMDLTHDNQSPIEKRSVFDMLPTAALISMACCATGSNRGYDELVPYHIHVVNENREYQEWNNGVDDKSGIIAAKRALNLLHGKLADEGFDQVYVDQMNPDIVAITRHSTRSHETVVLVAHTSFRYPDPQAGPTSVRSLRFEGNLEEIILEAGLTHNSSGKPFDRPYNFEKNAYINGLTEYELKIKENIPLQESNIFHKKLTHDQHVTQLDFANLKPGCVVAIRVSVSEEIRPQFKQLDELINSFNTCQGEKYCEVKEIINHLNLMDLNKAIYRCESEEEVYTIPGYGPLTYCGFQGFESLLCKIAPINDLGHPFCTNLRDGNWMIEYVYNRLILNSGTALLGEWLKTNMQPLNEIPRYLIPSYFDVIIRGVHKLLLNRCVDLMPNFIKNSNSFTKSIAMGSVQFMTISESANLPQLSSNISSPKPGSRCGTLAAGLPHFASGYMRCWGRDTFIAFRGLLLLTGRFDEARYIILGFAACLRHGLIPNLLDNGTNPRFNCRDAIWWWLYSIQQYVTEVPKGKSILTEIVSRIFPNDDSVAQPADTCDRFLYEVIQEALNVHFQGLVFRERNAGRQIDEFMTEKGFNNQIGINPNTGFVFGGNSDNCGTWMDKMGSSGKAGNCGVPTSPRDGSAVELIGLQYTSLRFLHKMAESDCIPYNSVERVGNNGEKTVWTFEDWADKIKENFEKEFFVPNLDGPLVNKKCIYKDSVGASKPWADYQLRCNFPITMVASPDLFNGTHAWEALEQAKNHLLGPLGMKTLDPDDWEYRGFYDNSNDSNDASIANGANYHQGPEWVWPIGYYLRARLIFAQQNNCLKKTVDETWSILRAHMNEINASPWRGLPELTNENGTYCVDSCRTQAWSMSTILETLYDLQIIEANQLNK